MKKLFLLLASCVLLGACSEAYDDTAIRAELEELKEQVALLTELESEVEFLQSAVATLQGNDYLIGIEEIKQEGVVIGYKFTFKQAGEVIVYSGTKGDDGQTPMMGVKEENGVYYWTVNGEFLLDDDGQKVPAQGEQGEQGEPGAAGVTPEFKIENDCWYVRYNETDGWKLLGPAVPSEGGEGTSFFQSVDTSDPNYVVLTLIDGTVLTLPKELAYEIVFAEVEGIGCEAGVAVDVPYTLTGHVGKSRIYCLGSAGWEQAEPVATDETSGVIRVTPPTPFVAGKVMVFANNDEGDASIKQLTFAEGQLTAVADVVEFSEAGGALTLTVTTNMVYTLSLPEWIKATNMRAMRNEELHFTVEPNSGIERTGEIVLKGKSGAELQKVAVYQAGSAPVPAELIDLSAAEQDVILTKAGGTVALPLKEAGYTAESANDWLTVTKIDASNFSVKVAAYTGFEERYGKVVVRSGSKFDELLITQRAKDQIVYVKVGGTGDGSSWENAFGTIEDGLATIKNLGGDYTPAEMWVGKGEYHLKDWTTFFRGVNFYGGFEGTEKKVSERNLNNKSELKASPTNTWNSIYCYKLEGVEAYVDGFIFSDSKASQGEGSLAVYEGWVLRNCVFRDNNTFKNSGGYFSGTKLINCLFYNNNTAGGGTIQAQGGATLYNVTVVNNTATSDAKSAGLYLGGNIAIYNSVIWGNSGGTASQVFLGDGAASTLTFDYNALQGGLEGATLNNCVELAAENAAGPKFVDPAAANFALQATSPLVDAGSSALLHGVTTKDIVGAERIVGSAVDMGAYEYQAQ